ncbi:hypothetical protein [Variovorax sp. 38R]|uniref:hypothetical protein n=1 Tax=Variovorax sp. 38R TaxID=2774875 RepID=UPI00178676DC|nr:hypothetical protein [Variovorax sp. 38R]QOF79302.1 hypothetical protein IG196_02535 [Variovorax sp. 38R]
MDQPIKPNNITKPIQLLAAWLAGLLAIDSCFLIAAARLPTGSWEAQALTVASIANVPLFLLAVFLLQTRFRPELQEDLYYSTYISQKTNARVALTKEDAASVALQQRLERLEVQLVTASTRVPRADEDVDLLSLRWGINKNFEDREAIARILSQAGVLGYTLFGSNEKPLHRVVALVPNLQPKIERAVLRLAADAGFKKYSYINEFEELEEQVLLGGYGDETLELTPPPEA